MNKDELKMIKDTAKKLTKLSYFSLPFFVNIFSSQIGVYGSSDSSIELDTVGNKESKFHRLIFKFGTREKFTFFATDADLVTAIIAFSHYLNSLEEDRKMEEVLMGIPEYLEIALESMDSLNNTRAAKHALILLAHSGMQEVLTYIGRSE